MTVDEKNLAAEIGARIAECRKNAKISQAALAIQIGQTPGSVGGYETGRIQPSISALFKMADALGVHPGRLLGFEGVDLDWSERELLRRYREQDSEGKLRWLNDRKLG